MKARLILFSSLFLICGLLVIVTIKPAITFNDSQRLIMAEKEEIEKEYINLEEEGLEGEYHEMQDLEVPEEKPAEAVNPDIQHEIDPNFLEEFREIIEYEEEEEPDPEPIR